MARTTNPRRQRRSLRLLALTFSALGTLVIVEVGVRALFRYNTPDTVRRNSLEYVPTIFARHLLAPDQEVRPHLAWGPTDSQERSERSYTVSDRGYRGKSFRLLPPEGVCRVVVLGGSAVFDPGADRGEDWPHLVERRLLESHPHEVEVINAGVPGHASADSLGRFFAQLWLFEPDLVLLYNAWNDIKTFTHLSRDRPLIALSQPLDPKANPFHYYRGFLDRLLANSQLYVKLRTRLLLWRYRPGSEGQLPREYRLADSWSPLALAQYRLNVELVTDAARNLGMRPILLTQASLLTERAPESDRARIAYTYAGLSHQALVDAMRSCNDTVRAIGREKAIDVLDLAARFDGRSDLFDDHVHTSKKGSRALASAVADFLAARLPSNCR